MKKILILFSAGTLLLASCDKVVWPEGGNGSLIADLYDLYPNGDSTHYWNNYGPDFQANSNTQRNVLLEDFTGHQCQSCPLAAEVADNIHNLYPTRVHVATIHAGPSGFAEGFQGIYNDFIIDWTNQDGLDIGYHLGQIPGALFYGNPTGTVNRIPINGQHTQSASLWQNSSEVTMQTTLQVNVQAVSNYFSATRGTFLHTEIEVLDPAIMGELYTVVYLIEDSAIGLQAFPSPAPPDPNYVHKEIMRDCISSGWRGIELNEENEVGNGKYRLDYIFELGEEYNPEKMHLLIYVRNDETEEVYHVIKQKIIE